VVYQVFKKESISPYVTKLQNLLHLSLKITTKPYPKKHKYSPPTDIKIDILLLLLLLFMVLTNLCIVICRSLLLSRISETRNLIKFYSWA